MSCNCKNVKSLQEGVKINESILSKAYRQFWKVIVLLISLVIAIIAVPVVVILLVWNQVFGDGKGLKFPDKLSKYIR